jgi:hypothetical protein
VIVSTVNVPSGSISKACFTSAEASDCSERIASTRVCGVRIRAIQAAKSRRSRRALTAPGTNPAARSVAFHSARELAEFRADCCGSLEDPQIQALIAELFARSPFFASAWAEQITLHLANRPGLKLVMLSPLAADVP